MRRTKQSRTAKYPHVVRLPKGAVSPTSGKPFTFDVVEQGKVVSTYVDAPRVVRSAAPFTLRALVGSKVKEFKSKLEN